MLFKIVLIYILAHYIYIYICVCVYMYTYVCVCVCVYMWASLVAQMAKDLPTNAGDVVSVPESRRCPGKGNG